MEFQLAKKIKKGKKLKDAVGVPYYISPEMIKEEYDQRTDIWSLGVLLFILLKGFPPFNGENSNKIFYKIKKFKIDFSIYTDLSNEAKDLLSKILRKSKSRRLTLLQIEHHPFFD